MSNVLEEMKTRRSIRKFKPDAIPQEILDKIIEAGTYAANGRGAQNVIIIQVTNKEKRDEIAKKNAEIMGSEGDPFYGAPAMLIVLGKKDWPTHVYDGSLVMGNLMLAAHDLGIGSCWIHRAKEEFESSWGRELLASLGIEDEYELTRTDRYVILYLQNSHQSNSVKNRLDKSFKAQEVQVLTIPRVLTIKYGMAFGKMACFCG